MRRKLYVLQHEAQAKCHANHGDRKLRRSRIAFAALILMVLFTGIGACIFPARTQVTAADADRPGPYVVPGQLDLPSPEWSVLKQPWRAYAQTVPAMNYLQGLGVMWGGIPAGKDPEWLAGVLHDAGFSRIRYELSWGAVGWDETKLESDRQADLVKVMSALRSHGLRPLILLNAHHLRPCPMQGIQTLTLKRAVAAGEKNLEVSGDFSKLVDWHTELISLTTSRQAGPLIATHDANTDRIGLSRSLSSPLQAGTRITVGTLKYLPLHPVGTPEYAETLAGWKRYVVLATNAVASAYGSDDFDVEIWNELGFGSAFLDMKNYVDAMPTSPGPDFLRRGGTAWTLADAAISELRETHPRVKVIWGFSSITFSHTPIMELPDGVSGQSYHPYNGEKHCFPQAAGKSIRFDVDGFVPEFCAAIPESIFATYQNPSNLLRQISPQARTTRPTGSSEFGHYMTEHGESGASFGLDSAQAQLMKAKFELRAPAFWINKGIKAIYTYHAYDPEDTGFGLLPAKPGEDALVLSALGRMTKRFSGSVPIGAPRQLAFDYASVGTSPGIYLDKAHLHVISHRDLVQILPYQIDAHRFVVPMYVMSWDFPADLPPETYDVVIHNVHGATAKIGLYDPLLDKEEAILIHARSADSVTLRLQLTDSVRLLEIAD